MNADLQALLGRCAGARVAVLGDLVADEFVYGETDRISREAPVLIVRYEHNELKPGCAANAIANLCALGARVQPVGVVGDDEIGGKLLHLLQQSGADVSLVQVAAGRPTATKTRILAGGRSTRRQQMIRIDRDGPGAPAPAVLTRVQRSLKEAAADCDAIMVSDYGLGLLAPPIVEALRSMAAQGKMV